MKQICRKLAAAVLCAALCLALAGCAKAGQAYPVSLGGVNITVGETTVGTLLDAGYTLRAVGENGAMGDVDSAAQRQQLLQRAVPCQGRRELRGP